MEPVAARLCEIGFSEADAQTLADHFVDAERRGKPSHGLSRIDWLAGLPDLDATARPVRLLEDSGYERWDGNGAVGYLTLGALLAGAAAQRRQQGYILGVAVLLTLLIGGSRVYLGVHWPTDVLAGWCFGLMWVSLWWRVSRSGEAAASGYSPASAAAPPG